MSSEPSIQILPSHKIDKEKWNACLRNAANNIIYARCEYLQYLADNWAGIIINDYEAIMPLPFRKKMGIRYYYDVPFIQQLGLFGKYDISLLKKMIVAATNYINYGDLFFNFQNDVNSSLPGIKRKENYVLSLASSHENINQNYSKHLQTKLKKAKTSNLYVEKNASISEAVLLFKQLYHLRLPQIKEDDFKRLEQAANYFSLQNQCFAYRIVDGKQNTLATALFFKDENRIYNILPATTPEGRKQNAMHFLLDHLIQKYSETQYLFDFEGSDVPGIKAFYQSFGAVSQPYYHYHFNHLPFPLKLLKR